MPAITLSTVSVGTYLTNGRVLALVMEQKGHLLAAEDCGHPDKWFPIRVSDVNGPKATWRVVHPSAGPDG